MLVDMVHFVYRPWHQLGIWLWKAGLLCHKNMPNNAVIVVSNATQNESERWRNFLLWCLLRRKLRTSCSQPVIFKHGKQALTGSFIPTDQWNSMFCLADKAYAKRFMMKTINMLKSGLFSQSWQALQANAVVHLYFLQLYTAICHRVV